MVVDNILDGYSVDTLHHFYADLAGAFGNLSELKQLSRQNLGMIPSVPRFSKSAHAFDYFRLIDYLASHGDGRGWLILIDELELISGLGKKSRMQAYQGLRQLTNGALPHTYVVAGLAQSYVETVLPNDGAILEWLSGRGDQALMEDAQAIRDLMVSQRETARLSRLTQQDLVEVIRQIIADYEAGYGWETSLSSEELYRLMRTQIHRPDVQLRNLIRGVIYWLDIERQYAHPPTQFGIRRATESLAYEGQEDNYTESIEESSTGVNASIRRRNLLTGKME